MSKLAGGLLVLFGIGIAYVGFKEVITPVNLTAYASYTSLILGALLFIAGLAHFRAPHKAFFNERSFTIGVSASYVLRRSFL